MIVAIELKFGTQGCINKLQFYGWVPAFYLKPFAYEEIAKSLKFAESVKKFSLFSKNNF